MPDIDLLLQIVAPLIAVVVLDKMQARSVKLHHGPFEPLWRICPLDFEATPDGLRAQRRLSVACRCKNGTVCPWCRYAAGPIVAIVTRSLPLLWLLGLRLCATILWLGSRVSRVIAKHVGQAESAFELWDTVKLLSVAKLEGEVACDCL